MLTSGFTITPRDSVLHARSQTDVTRCDGGKRLVHYGTVVTGEEGERFYLTLHR